MRIRSRNTAAALAVSAALAACGGGGSSTAPSAPITPVAPVAPAAITFSGVAATGSAMTGATVRVTDSRGQQVAVSAPVGADGRYSVTLAEGAVAPFVVVASLADGAPQVAVIAAAQTSTVNVTPVTSLVAARLSSNGLPQGLERDFATAASVPTAARITTTTDDVVRTIAPLAQALSESTHPVTGNFQVGGSGHDRLLDTLAVTITPTSATESNIELTLKTRREEDQPMPAVSFASSARDLPVVPAVDSNRLVTERASAKMAELVARINACYATTPADRIDSSSGTATIKPGPCREMFFGGDPAGYLHNGLRAAPGAAFAGLFSGSLTSFDRPVFEYERAGTNDVVFTLHWTTPAGVADTIVLVARPQGDTLRLIGNQYEHPMDVRPIVHKYEFVRPDVADMDFTTVGYTLAVANRRVNGLPVYDRVEVMAPVGLEGGATREKFVLRPMAGHTSLRMTGNWSASQSSQVVRLSAAFHATRTAEPLHPRQITSSGAVWVDGQSWSDERIERMAHKGVWTFHYFLAGNAGATPNAVQHMTTISRAPSLREASMLRTAALDDASMAFIRRYSMEPSARIFWFGARPDAAGDPTTTTPKVALSWNVPAGAVTPLSLWLWGRTTTSYAIAFDSRTSFDAGSSFNSLQRQATVNCPVGSISATLCDGADPTHFSRMTMLTDFELSGIDDRLVSVVKSYKPYVPTVRVVD